MVAGEVRSLAHRSAVAAKEIKGLIEDSTQNVVAGASLVTQAGETMGRFLVQIQGVGLLIGQINAATGEKTLGIGNISKAVSRIDDVTQHNAALVEQSAAAAESLRNESLRLFDAVHRFKLEPVAY